ncbi:MAG: flippase-like domain-containing protein [Rubrivivax sp.]|nr:MAG: flippase-like domain-containing protein [Rubrivivax sp.]
MVRNHRWMLDNRGLSGTCRTPSCAPPLVIVPPNSTPSAHGPALRSRLKLALAWALGFALLGWLLSRTPWALLSQAVQRPTAWIWCLTLAGLLLSYGLRGARLQVVLDLDEHHQAPRRWLGLRTDALRVILLHNAAVNLLPMRAGELSFPWLASRELNLPVSRAVVCLVWMRLQDLAVLAGLGLALWPGLPFVWRILGLAALILGWHGGWWLLRRWLARPSAHSSATPSPADQGWRGMAAKLQAALLEPAHHRPMAWVLTLANWSLKLAAGATLLSAISQTAWPVAWAGALGGELAAIFPLQGPAGFGTYEAGVWAGMAALLPQGSEALSHAVGAALALHVCFLICAVGAAGLAALLSGPIGLRRAQEGLPPRHPG